jgi:hypothetical protein
MRILLRLSTAVILVSATAAAQDEPSLLYRNNDYKFGVIFPNTPMARDITYITKDGAFVPGRQFYVEQGDDRYSVTLVKLPDGPAVDFYEVKNAGEQIQKKGAVRFAFAHCYDPGIPGRQINLSETNGRQLRGSAYMWNHQLYITEASAAEGSPTALQFEQSITILDANGNDLDTGQGSPDCESP